MEYIVLIVFGVFLLVLFSSIRLVEDRVENIEIACQYHNQQHLRIHCIPGLICPDCGCDFIRLGNYYDWDIERDSLNPDFDPDARFCCRCTYTGLEEEFTY